MQCLSLLKSGIEEWYNVVHDLFPANQLKQAHTQIVLVGNKSGEDGNTAKVTSTLHAKIMAEISL